jgi:hypothetical protein
MRRTENMRFASNSSQSLTKKPATGLLIRLKPDPPPFIGSSRPRTALPQSQTSNKPCDPPIEPSSSLQYSLCYHLQTRRSALMDGLITPRDCRDCAIRIAAPPPPAIRAYIWFLSAKVRALASLRLQGVCPRKGRSAISSDTTRQTSLECRTLQRTRYIIHEMLFCWVPHPKDVR